MRFDGSSLLAGLLLGVLLTVCLAFPRVGRTLARVIAVLLFVGGIGLIAWAVGGLSMGAELTAFEVGPVLIAHPSDAFGWGAGLLAGGILTLVLSSLRPTAGR